MPRTLQFREFRLLIAAVSVFIFAEGMWTVVMALQVIALADDPAAQSLVATCLAGGMLAFILVGGIVADRVSQRAIIITVEAVNLAAVAAVAALGALGCGCGTWPSPRPSSEPGRRLLPRLQRLPAADRGTQHLLAANGIEGTIRPTLGQAMGRDPPVFWSEPPSRRWAARRSRCCSPSAWSCWYGHAPSQAVHAVANADREKRHPLVDLRDGWVFVLRV